MTDLYTTKELRIIEERALSGLPCGALMQRAGKAAAELALRLLASPDKNTKVLILAGPGNNGGDALEMAIHLAAHAIEVSVLQPDSTPRTEECQLAQKRAFNSAVKWENPLSIPSLSAQQWDLIADGMFGIGLKKPLQGNWRQLAEMTHTANCPVIAVDVPSGLDADTGNIHGKNGVAVKATDTVTFLADKPGLHTGMGRDYAGKIHLARLDTDENCFPDAKCQLNQPALFAPMLQKRRHNSHKGTYGKVAILGGATGMTGAPVLAARTALHSGAGLVYAVYPEETPPYDSIQPELMFRPAQAFDFSSAVSVAGPGLGISDTSCRLIEQIINTPQPLVLDADALNLVARETTLQHMLKKREAPTILTPHPLEAARLLNTTTETVQTDRLSAARELAKQFHAVAILKGSGTVIAGCNGKTAINPTGGPALATPGSGDVLSGICGALMAQGWPAMETALASVWLHGNAADELVKKGEGPIGLTASELIPEIRRILNRLVRENTR
ncbi:MAG: NAD(P)H-hydrate dehydratase [Oxalobacter formigenes]|nr:NAD(P)H-hydrate dehydratase [Oxalobacter formigenes]